MRAFSTDASMLCLSAPMNLKCAARVAVELYTAEEKSAWPERTAVEGVGEGEDEEGEAAAARAYRPSLLRKSCAGVSRVHIGGGSSVRECQPRWRCLLRRG